MQRERLLVLVACGLLLGACYEQHGRPQVGGESHFLSACESSCTGELECLAGACTLACASDAECTELVVGATCLELGATVGTCGVECVAHADCRSLGTGFACLGGECRPVEVEVALTTEPLVMLLVDTSGSMEKLPVCSECPECNKCQPDCSRGDRNRWAHTLEALTGTWQEFGCEALERTLENGMSYDIGYSLYYHRPVVGPQEEDGIIDRYGERVRFGVATFDGWDTYFGFPPLVEATHFNVGISGSMNGLWSYGPLDGRTGVFYYPNCTTRFRMDTGIRGPQAVDGALTVALDDGDLTRLNARIQARLASARPYGGTPIAAALDDLGYYFDTDPEIAGVPVESRHVILVTDGLPDDDYRKYKCDCTHNDPAGDPSTYCGPQGPLTVPANMYCPYPTPEDAARYLAGASPEQPLPSPELVRSGPPLVASLSVVGLAIDDATVEEKLHAIARAGGSSTAAFATTGPELRAALSEILDRILAADAPH